MQFQPAAAQALIFAARAVIADELLPNGIIRNAVNNQIAAAALPPAGPVLANIVNGVADLRQDLTAVQNFQATQIGNQAVIQGLQATIQTMNVEILENRHHTNVTMNIKSIVRIRTRSNSNSSSFACMRIHASNLCYY